MSTLFEKTNINGMEIQNRIVRSATWEGMCEADGRPTQRLIDWYRNLAAGEVGLITTGYTFVRPDGKQLPGNASSPHVPRIPRGNISGWSVPDWELSAPIRKGNLSARFPRFPPA